MALNGFAVVGAGDQFSGTLNRLIASASTVQGRSSMLRLESIHQSRLPSIAAKAISAPTVSGGSHRKLCIRQADSRGDSAGIDVPTGDVDFRVSNSLTRACQALEFCLVAKGFVRSR